MQESKYDVYIVMGIRVTILSKKILKVREIHPHKLNLKIHIHIEVLVIYIIELHLQLMVVLFESSITGSK